MSLQIQCQECHQLNNCCLRTYPKNITSEKIKHFISDSHILALDLPEELGDQSFLNRLHFLSKTELSFDAVWTQDGFLIFRGHPVMTFAQQALKLKNREFDPNLPHSDPQILKEHYELPLIQLSLDATNPIAYLEHALNRHGPCLVPISEKNVDYVVVTKIVNHEISFLDCYHGRGVTVAIETFKKIISFVKPVVQIKKERVLSMRVETIPDLKKMTPPSPTFLTPKTPSPQKSSPILVAFLNRPRLNSGSDELLKSDSLESIKEDD